MSDASPRASSSPLGLVSLALWFGVVAGLAELVVQGVRRYAMGELLFVSRDVLWMAPLADALLLLAVTLVLLVLGAAVRPLRSATAVVFAGAATTLLGVLLLFPEIHVLAMLAVALGGGAQLARTVGRRAGFVRFAQRTGWLLLALVLIGALGQSWWRSSREAAAVAELPAPPAGAPNVLLMVMDTVRAASLSAYGYQQPTTPRIEELAQSSVLFERPIATAPWTLPSHGSLFTGRFHHEMSANWADPLDDEHPTLAEGLAAHGYATGGFAANLNYTSWEVGLARGFQHYQDYPVTLGQIVLSSSLGRALTNWPAFRELVGYHDNLNRKTAAQINEEFLGWVEGVAERPWFAFVNYYDAHGPYLPAPEFDPFDGAAVPRGELRYDTNLIEVDNWHELEQEAIDNERAYYEASIRWLDDEIGRLLDVLRERGVLDDTVVILTSDHGEQFGEHKLFDHGNSLYTQNVWVPLLVRYPARFAQAARVSRTVSLRDVPATVFDLAGVANTAALPGHSLARHVGVDELPEDAPPDIVLSAGQVIEGKRAGDNQSLVVGPYHYIRNGDGSEELYDLDKDIEQRRDLTLTKAGRDALPRFREALDRVLGKD